MRAITSRRRLICLALLLIGTSAWGVDVTVTTTTDENNGSLNPGLGSGVSLREAILHADAGSHIVIHDSLNGQTFTLAAGEIPIGKDLEIDASGLDDGITVSGNHVSRVFNVAASKTVTIKKVYLINGDVTGNGGAILNAGSLTLMNCKLSGSEATGSGGAIHSTGSLILDVCELSGNTSSGNGGAILATGSLALDDCKLSGNVANGNGGAVHGTSTSTLAGCELAGNTAHADGGAILGTGGLSLYHCELSGNHADDGGGAIENSATLNLFSSTLAGNTAAVGGGAIEHTAGILSATNCTFSGNTADIGGAIDGDGSSTIRLYSCTVSANVSTNDGGGLEETSGTLLLENTIVAGNSATDQGPDLKASGLNTQAGVNLVSNTSGLGGSFSGIVASPNLAALAFNGGKTRTMKPLPGSPAIDAAGATTFPMDQRGRQRLVGAAADIGAVELQVVNYFTTAALTTPGLVGSYVNTSLAAVTAPDDWRATQTISGTRTDAVLEFTTAAWGSRAAVGVSGGNDADWENFSVQWDGYLQVTQAGDRVATVSDEGSRMWVDVDDSGTYEPAELIDNGWGKFQLTRIGDRSAALPLGVHKIRIQYYEASGGNEFHLARTPWVPQQFVPVAGNPKQIVRVIVFNYEPRIPSKGNKRLWEALEDRGFTDPRKMIPQFESDLEFATGGAIDLQIVEIRHLEEFPLFRDGYRFEPDEYENMRRIKPLTDSYFDRAVGFDLDHLVKSQGLEAMVNSGQIDEIWVFGDHPMIFGIQALGEAWMAGPGAFNINGPVYPEIAFGRAIAGYGFNYERGVGEMVHNLCHRIEQHGQRAFGTWQLANPVSIFDKFSANPVTSPGKVPGVGRCHEPAIADAEYDYADFFMIQSTAFDFPNYPALTGVTTLVGRDTWGFGPVADYQRDYLDFYIGMLPRKAGTAGDGRQANWFKYVWDFNGYEPGTGLRRNEDAFASGAAIHQAGGTQHDFAVRYYDVTGINMVTLGSGDVNVSGPNGFSQAATLVSAGTEEPTTAGTARTVTYRINAPAGTWDAADTGAYRVNMVASQVQDTLGNAVPAGDIGGFQVQIADATVIDVVQMLGNSSASVTHTSLDIGSIADLFDSSTSTLIRTANINPAVVTLTFTTAQSFQAFHTYFSHAAGNPAYQWKIETADTLADLNGQSGTWQLAVPLTGTPSDVYSIVTLPATITAKLVRLTATRLTGDNFVHMEDWRLVGPVVSDTTAPAASGSSANVTAAGGTSHFIGVTYTDEVAVDIATLGNGDLLVTGPGGFAVPAFFYGVNNPADGSPRQVTYWFIPPGSAWDSGDNGTYTYTLQSPQVADTAGNTHATSRVLGSFTVLIAGNGDSDGDEMPDTYELAHSFDPQNAADALLDADADGFTNVEEFRAGSDPLDANSRFVVVDIVTSATHVTLSWRSAPGRTYLIETSLDLVNWIYLESDEEPLIVDAAEVEDVTTYAIPIGALGGRNFMRVELFTWSP